MGVLLGIVLAGIFGGLVSQGVKQTHVETMARDGYCQEVEAGKKVWRWCNPARCQPHEWPVPKPEPCPKEKDGMACSERGEYCECKGPYSQAIFKRAK